MKERQAQVEQPMEAAPTEAAEPESAAGNLFDLRVLIGGLFSFYGVVLVVAGALASSAELHKAASININLWMGIGMFVLGVLFLIWWRVSPLRVERAPEPLQQEPPKVLKREQQRAR